jgi:hypothetical protein
MQGAADEGSPGLGEEQHDVDDLPLSASEFEPTRQPESQHSTAESVRTVQERRRQLGEFMPNNTMQLNIYSFRPYLLF